MKAPQQQRTLLFELKMAAKRHHTHEIIYKSEWLGYPPYGQHHWLEVGGEELVLSHPDSLYKDLSGLTQIGALKIAKQVQLNDEDSHIYYQLHT